MNAKTSLLFSLFISLALSGGAADKPLPTFLEPADGGADYTDQGEYVNDWGGAQVVALGNDEFRLVLHRGGLPGDGWDGSEKRELNGKRAGKEIRFKSDREGWSHRLANGTLTTETGDGSTYTMKKAERKSPTMGAKPPEGALVLFDGSNTEEWRNGHMDERKLLPAGTTSTRSFGDYTLHLEFRTPFKPLGRGQGRGNSGVYMQNRYEIQVLDSFGLAGLNNECGGIYSKAAPKINMCYPPLVWQTYDIDFEAARFDAAGKKTKNAVVTVKHNGVTIHDRQEIDGPTGGGRPETPEPGPIQLQGHGNPVFYRNIWILEKPGR